MLWNFIHDNFFRNVGILQRYNVVIYAVLFNLQTIHVRLGIKYMVVWYTTLKF